MTNIELVSFTVKKHDGIPNMRKIIGIDKLPLSNSYVSLEIKNIPTAYINAIRRVSIDEMTGHALKVDTQNNWYTTDDFMLPEFVSQRISLIPLKLNIGNDVISSVRFELIAENLTNEVMTLYSRDFKIHGKLTEPIFNPTFKICILQPGKKIHIKDICITNGIGKDNIAFQRVRCGAYKHLDLEEYSNEELYMNNLELDRTNVEGTRYATDYSGYKKSCMLTNPMHHLFTCIIPATNDDVEEIRQLFIEVCNNIKERLRYILSHIESHDSNDQNIEFNIFQSNEGIYEGILQVTNETYTIGELLKRTIYELYPDIINIKYVIISHVYKLKMTIYYKEDISKLLIKTIKYCIQVFDNLQKQIKIIKISQ